MSEDKNITIQDVLRLQEEIKQLSQRKVELEKRHQQQIFLYRWLQGPDPELQAVNTQIADLEEDEDNYFKILQAAASIPQPVPEKDWSDSPFYTQFLKDKFGFATPGDQIMFVAAAGGGASYMLRSFGKSYHLSQYAFHYHDPTRSLHHEMAYDFTDRELKRAIYYSRRIAAKGIIFGLGAPYLFFCSRQARN